MSLFWFRSCSSKFYKTSQSTDSLVKKIEYKVDHLPGRHSNLSQVKRGVNSGQRYSNLSATKSGFSQKQKEISVTTNINDTIFGCEDRFCQNGIEASSREGRQNNISVMPVEGEKVCNLEGIDFVDRQVDFVSYGSSSSTSAISCNVETANLRIGIGEKFSVSNRFEPGSQSRTRLVDSEFISKQWEGSSPKLRSTVDVFRHLKGGLGCLLPGPENRRSLGHTGKTISHQLSGAESSKVSCSNIRKDFSFHQGNSSSNGQYDSISIFKENRGYQESHVSKDHDYCRTFSREIECGSRFRVSVGQGLQRMEAVSKNF